MEESYELKYHELERNHWWFVARRDMILKLLKNIGKDSKILDIGCSGGALIEFLNRRGYYNIQGIDISQNAISLCKEKGIKDVFVMDCEKINFYDKELDIIISSDILEHIRNDNSVLDEWNRIIKPDGKIIIFVPAFKFLWSKHDEINHHYKRYSKSELISLLRSANFRVEKSSYWNFSLFFPILLLRISRRIFLKNEKQVDNQLVELNQIINNILIHLVKFENWFLDRITLPVGVSVFAVARKIR